LVLGAVIGAIAAKLSRRAGATTDRDMTLRDLEERVEHAVAQLRDLQLQESRVDPAFFAGQRAELEARAAAALRERDQVLAGKAVAPDVIASGPDRPKREATAEVSPFIAWLDQRPWAKSLAWVIGIAAVGGILIASVAIEQRPREGGMQGPMQGSGTAELLAQARKLLAAQRFEEAEALVERVRASDPENGVARVYEAVLLAARGDSAGAATQLDRLVAENPRLADAWLFRGMLAMQGGDMERMRESFTQFVAVAPESPQRERIRAMLQGAQP
jgi:tetratricopeptide (TPR) repeat protein